MGITAKIAKLNESDLSKLSGRIADLQKQAETVTLQASTATQQLKSASATGAGSGLARSRDGLTTSQLINELAQAKRSAS